MNNREQSTKKNNQQNQQSFQKGKQVQVKDQNEKGIKKIQQKQMKKQQNSIDQISKSLEGSKFRMLNEFLYTENSQIAKDHFKNNKEDFLTYHQGFRNQTENWPTKPYEAIIKELESNQKLYQDKILCDLGCGDALIYEYFRDNNRIKNLRKFYEKPQINKSINIQQIHNFDLVSHKKFIKEADMANIPLEDNQVDVSIFCLSLMGINYIEFIQELKDWKQSDK
ncbi:hypothetical protein PPERSA_04755 [Pseudocohnilembus persalinus]|uniref:Ribosomal RNA-processing protein 8 n=1 Tax=Pseudocohnilembus persalinus TaxID=266149 RepID=A0A0V0QPE7_PSEPJ|nr:hypothetical protein PPERSA_04755 [Pseudocohnilembus persalinus]|eukprot:KRX03877.1 hypothetical protein PPERSA_04755 [Pseudocohnilembus persalinus]